MTSFQVRMIGFWLIYAIWNVQKLHSRHDWGVITAGVTILAADIIESIVKREKS